MWEWPEQQLEALATENIYRQRRDETGSLNDSNLIWMKVWWGVRRTHSNKLEQTAKGCCSFSIISCLSKKIILYTHTHIFILGQPESFWGGYISGWNLITCASQEVILGYYNNLPASLKNYGWTDNFIWNRKKSLHLNYNSYSAHERTEIHDKIIIH